MESTLEPMGKAQTAAQELLQAVLELVTQILGKLVTTPDFFCMFAICAKVNIA
jgi:hypothetical protein